MTILMERPFARSVGRGALIGLVVGAHLFLLGLVLLPARQSRTFQTVVDQPSESGGLSVRLLARQPLRVRRASTPPPTVPTLAPFPSRHTTLAKVIRRTAPLPGTAPTVTPHAVDLSLHLGSVTYERNDGYDPEIATISPYPRLPGEAGTGTFVLRPVSSPASRIRAIGRYMTCSELSMQRPNGRPQTAAMIALARAESGCNP